MKKKFKKEDLSAMVEGAPLPLKVVAEFNEPSGVSTMKYAVSIPITGSIYIELDAKSEEDAIAKAWEAYGDGWENHFDAPDWEALEEVVSGNVFHGMINSQYADKIDEAD